jgi:hypothetical protein
MRIGKLNSATKTRNPNSRMKALRGVMYL